MDNMLRRLTIRNLAVVDDLQVGFGDGLNVITGETGAGKSLLMGALRLCWGIGQIARSFARVNHNARFWLSLVYQILKRSIRF